MRRVLKISEVVEFVHDLLSDYLGHGVVPDPEFDEDRDVDRDDNVDRVVLVLDDGIDRGLESKDPDDTNEDFGGAEAVEEDAAHDVGRDVATEDEIIAASSCLDLVEGHVDHDLNERGLARQGLSVLVATTVDVAVGEDGARIGEHAENAQDPVTEEPISHHCKGGGE